MSDFLVVTGLSGAGRSAAGDVLEDMGWFILDNLPPSLLGSIADLVDAPGSEIQRVVVGVGTGPYHDEILQGIADLRERVDRVRVLFLEAPREVLVRRYENTRRRHPLDDGSNRLTDAIDREVGMLQPIKAEADVVLNTADFNVHELRERIQTLFGDDDDDRMHITLLSFGFKHGLPRDTDMVFDCRFLPNPHWVPELRPFTGLDQPVRDYVFGRPETQEFMKGLENLVLPLLPAFEKEGKSYLTISLGCTGGHHRSVAMTEALAETLREQGFTPSVQHRDIER
jgi:RNase adapter protein RapZ